MKGSLNKNLTSGAKLPSLAFRSLGYIYSQNPLRSFQDIRTTGYTIFGGKSTWCTGSRSSFTISYPSTLPLWIRGKPLVQGQKPVLTYQAPWQNCGEGISFLA